MLFPLLEVHDMKTDMENVFVKTCRKCQFSSKKYKLVSCFEVIGENVDEIDNFD